MQTIGQFFQPLLSWAETIVTKHPGDVLLVVGIIATASILSSTLPKAEEIWPDANSRHGAYFAYRTLYLFLHVIALNFGRIFPWLRITPNGTNGGDPGAAK